MRASSMALDADEERVWFRVGREEAGKHLPEGTEIEEPFGPRKMGAGPSWATAGYLHFPQVIL